MGRIFKIIIWAIILIFLYFWIMTIAKSCGSSNPVDAVVDQAENVVDGVSDVIEDASDEFFDEEDGDAEEDEDDFDEVEGEDEIDYEELDAEIEDDFEEEPAETDVPERNSTPVRQASNTGSGGSYMLVAGSYLVNDNARAMKNKLDRMGYNASIVQFDGSSYYTVIAGRYDSNSSAQSAGSDLNSRGIDNYVHRKQY